MFFIKKIKEYYIITYFGLPIKIEIHKKKNFDIIFLNDVYNRISVDFKYEKESELFEKYLTLLLKDLYYNYIKEGIVFHEFKEQLKELINNHFGEVNC